MTSSFRERISSSNLCRSGRSVDPPEYPPSSYRDGQEHIESQPAHGGRGIELLGDRDKRDAFSLVTELNVETDRLLRPTANKFDLVAIVQVDVRATRLTFGNIGISG